MIKEGFFLQAQVRFPNLCHEMAIEYHLKFNVLGVAKIGVKVILFETEVRMRLPTLGYECLIFSDSVTLQRGVTI